MPIYKNEKLRAFLTENNARLLNSIDTKKFALRFYQIHAIVAIVQIWLEDGGFDIYIPASTENSIDATFEAVKKKAYCLES